MAPVVVPPAVSHVQQTSTEHEERELKNKPNEGWNPLALPDHPPASWHGEGHLSAVSSVDVSSTCSSLPQNSQPNPRSAQERAPRTANQEAHPLNSGESSLQTVPSSHEHLGAHKRTPAHGPPPASCLENNTLGASVLLCTVTEPREESGLSAADAENEANGEETQLTEALTGVRLGDGDGGVSEQRGVPAHAAGPSRMASSCANFTWPSGPPGLLAGCSSCEGKEQEKPRATISTQLRRLRSCVGRKTCSLGSQAQLLEQPHAANEVVKKGLTSTAVSLKDRSLSALGAVSPRDVWGKVSNEQAVQRSNDVDFEDLRPRKMNSVDRATALESGRMSWAKGFAWPDAEASVSGGMPGGAARFLGCSWKEATPSQAVRRHLGSSECIEPSHGELSGRTDDGACGSTRPPLFRHLSMLPWITGNPGQLYAGNNSVKNVLAPDPSQACDSRDCTTSSPTSSCGSPPPILRRQPTGRRGSVTAECWLNSTERESGQGGELVLNELDHFRREEAARKFLDDFIADYPGTKRKRN